MSKVMKFILFMSGVILYSYLVGSIGSSSFNPFEWTKEMKFIVLLVIPTMAAYFFLLDFD